jgi:peptidoglycan/xylan/chitin deacetylase (PgdA/CDA1 family)
MTPTILLSYDVEEFDMPMEYGGHIDLERQLAISTEGMERLLRLLDQYNIRCTFYCTATYALHRKALIKSLYDRGFEIASHGYYHSHFQEEDLLLSKKALEEIIQERVYGYRMARMMPLRAAAVNEAGYLYNSSLNPTWIPGRYNNLKKPRKLFWQDRLLQFPASVSPYLRIPLFWLGFHNYPIWFYLRLCEQVLKKDGYANIYFHPWEFVDYEKEGGAIYPKYVVRNSGEAMLKRTETLIKWGLQKGYAFDTTINWLQREKHLEIENQNKMKN